MAIVDNSVEAKPRALCFGHILFLVEDLEKAVAFYESKLGFTIRPAKPLADGRHFVAFDQGIALVAGRKADHRQVDHVAFEVNDVRALRDRLKEDQIYFFKDLHHGPYGLTIYIADPDGLKVELYQTGLTADDDARSQVRSAPAP